MHLEIGRAASQFEEGDADRPEKREGVKPEKRKEDGTCLVRP